MGRASCSTAFDPRPRLGAGASPEGAQPPELSVVEDPAEGEAGSCPNTLCDPGQIPSPSKPQPPQLYTGDECASPRGSLIRCSEGTGSALPEHLRLMGQGGRGTEDSGRRHEAFLEVAARRFPSIGPVTQDEAWSQALPGPVTQFPQFCRAITPHLFLGLEAWLV